MLNIYIQLQNKRSYFLTSRKLSPNPAHNEKLAIKIRIIHNRSKIKQTKNDGEKKDKRKNKQQQKSLHTQKGQQQQ